MRKAAEAAPEDAESEPNAKARAPGEAGDNIIARQTGSRQKPTRCVPVEKGRQWRKLIVETICLDCRKSWSSIVINE